MFSSKLVSALLVLLCCLCCYVKSAEQSLFDFTDSADVSDWTEQSDTVRAVGQSKAVFALHNNTQYRRAVFFALLNPLENGAAFAGVRHLGTTYDLSCNTELQILCRGQGNYNGFKIVLRHQNLNDDPNYTYEQYFQAPLVNFATVSLPLSNFTATFRGVSVDNATLDTSQVSAVGIQMYGGVYLDVKQSGPATLEVDWIKAV